MLQNKKILIGITGGAAIYKICSLIRILKREGAQIIVVLTKNAKKMISSSY